MPLKKLSDLYHKKIKILLVEDSPADAEIIGRELKKSGLNFTISVVHTKADYINELKEPPDIILCDHSLPDFNSIEALEIVQEKNLKIPFILITGAISEDFSIQIIKKGGTDYIIKDRITRLPSAIANALEKYRIQKELSDYIEVEISKEKIENDRDVLSKLEMGAIIDSSPNHIALLDSDGTIIAVNKAWKEFAEQNKLEDFNYGLGKNYIHISQNALGSDKKIGEKAAEGIKNILGGSIDKFSLDYPCNTPKEKLWFRLIVSPLKIGNSNGAMVMHQNVSEMKFAELELTRTEKKYQTLVENAGDIIALLSAEGIIEYVSPSIKILGYEPKELIGKNFTFSTHPDDEVKKGDIFDELLKAPDKEISSIHRIQHKDGSYKWLEGIKINKLHDENIRAIVANFRDITERKEAELKLANAYRLYYFISHINQAIIHNQNEQDLFDAVCEIAINQGKLKMAWIGLTENEKGIIKMRAQCGASQNTREILARYKYSPGGPIDRVLKGADYSVINDIKKEYKSAWKNFGREEQFNSAITLPIKKSGQVIGIYSLYYPEVNYFDEAEINLLTEAAGDISFALDVMEKKRLHEIAEKKVADSEKTLKVAQAIAHVGSWEIDVAKGISIWSEECCRIYGVSPKNNVHTFETWKTFIHPDDLEFVLKTFDEVEPTLTNISLSFRIVRPDRTERYLFSQLQYTLNEEGAITSVTGVVHDITERYIAEQEKEFTKNNLAALINSTTNLMWSVDTNFKLITSNYTNDEAVKKIFGKDLKLGESILKVFPNERMMKRYKKHYERAFSGERFTEVEFFESPEKVWLEISFYPMLDAGKVIGTACFAQDITQRILAEEEKEKLTKDIFQRNKNLEQFAYIISHNLRAPVANILGFAEELSDETYGEEDKKIFLEEMLSGVKRLDRVIKDLNEILHLNKEADSQKEEIFLSQLVHSIKTSIVNLLAKDQVEIKTNFHDLKKINTLKSYLYSIFQNLIVNSIKYKKPGVTPEITITSGIRDGKAILTFSDNGTGIDLDRKGDQVFGLYKRFHPDIEGKGMGLFMVKSQVENLGGSIKVHSKINEGTTFEIELPL
ncbi:MAG: PAS domain S-box protein [Bacteroidetes bacterium]|nr:PAS domain S-box protein [Bacteroidota bacterium]